MRCMHLADAAGLAALQLAGGVSESKQHAVISSLTGLGQHFADQGESYLAHPS